MKSLFSLLLLAPVAAMSFLAAPMHAQTFTVLHAFGASGDGLYPLDTLVLANGKLYGTASEGGKFGYGMVFQVDLKGNEVVLYNFGGPSGAFPDAGLVRDAAGNFYGTTTEGGTYNAGTVFKITPEGVESVLYNFTGGADGATPFSSLVLDKSGNLYGTTSLGGDLNVCASQGCGTAFKLDSSGNESVLYSFTDGSPRNVILDPAGNLLGTTPSGGTFGQGAIFKVQPNGAETVLYSFTGGSNGGEPFWPTLVNRQGTLYGTTISGGTRNQGTVFSLNTKGQETVLHRFAGPTSDGAYPVAGVIFDAQGNMYGMTNGGGTRQYGVVYKLAPNGTETVLHTFSAATDGGTPNGALVMDAQGNLYGTTATGGPQRGGTVFMITP